MAKNLLIVESPAKAKTIEKFLGKDFEVVSSFGHIRDLVKEGMGVDIEKEFAPTYVVSPEKKKVVSELKSKAKKAKEVWLATDGDREGEAISWHLCEVLNLDPNTTKRIIFNEITKSAILEAIKNPSTVNMHLVEAQQARRVLDRLVGFEISPILWRKLPGAQSLSAGRVQSVAVRLIVEREREIQNFEPESSFRIVGDFIGKDSNTNKEVSFAASAPSLNSQENAENFLKNCEGAKFTVKNVEVKPGKRNPAAPFTTSTLQQEASRKLGLSVGTTMRIAQQLYESGYITYMRTDSTVLSDSAIKQAEETIKKLYGEKYHKARVYKTKNQSAQEAHEAIRPTDMNLSTIENYNLKRLYELIWKRTIASQMAEAQMERTSVHIGVSTLKEEFIAKGEVVKFDGFLKVYLEGKDDDDDEENQEGILPKLNIGASLKNSSITATERFSRSSARYTEASLVKKLEDLGIGRPSTYAPTISTIQQRKYVEKKNLDGEERSYAFLELKNNKITKKTKTEIAGAEKQKLFPTDLGIVVTDFLNKHFTQIMDYKFTAKIEEEFDTVAEGRKEWNEMLGQFYKPFHETVEETLETAERTAGERLLGEDPESGKPIIARLGKFGPIVQIGSGDDEEKPKYASLRMDQSIETISLEEALDLFKLPFSLEDYKDKEVMVAVGRYGPYVRWGDTFISIPKDEDPLNVNQKRAEELIEEKIKADAPIAEYDGYPITKGVGRFGPYLKWRNLFVNVPKAYDFDNLTQEEIHELVSKKIEKEANRYIKVFEEEGISIENGRWGPFIKINRKNVKIPTKKDGEKYSVEELKEVGLEQIKKWIEEADPKLLKKKKTKTKTKAKAKTTTKTKTKKKK